jgi:phage gp29-like protein
MPSVEYEDTQFNRLHVKYARGFILVAAQPSRARFGNVKGVEFWNQGCVFLLHRSRARRHNQSDHNGAIQRLLFLYHINEQRWCSVRGLAELLRRRFRTNPQ